MSSLGERKCALLLASLRKSDRRRLLRQLPLPSAHSIRQLLAQLDKLPFAVDTLADDLLAEEVRGLTARTSLELEQLVALSRDLSPSWFARVLSVWTGVDRNFCLAMLEREIAIEVGRELAAMTTMPPKLVEAIKIEAAASAPKPSRREVA